MKQQQDQPTFHLGLTMAGAVSAGAYTAGVMDCLLEILQEWEDAKLKSPDDPLVPQHKVLLEVLGGASAGGMTAAVTMMGLLKGIKPANFSNQKGTDNVLYDSWIKMADDESQSTVQKLLDPADVTEKGAVYSLLNSSPIDEIATNAAKGLGTSSGSLPSYVSKDLHVLMTLSNLRGISVGIDFTTGRTARKNPPVHKMNFHKAIAHFRLNKAHTVDDAYLLFDPTDQQSLDRFVNCAKATGAFPVGLKDRHFTNFPASYIKQSTERLFQAIGESAIKFDWEELGEDYHFSAVDGGMTNNEPFGETVKILEKIHRQQAPKTADAPSNYGIIMINPFPDFEKRKTPYKKPEHLLEAIPQVFKTLRQQSVFKQADLIDAYKGNYTRAMIYPVRRGEDGKKQPNAIACGALQGFGGFFSREFREHDFKLGRRNCRDFLNYYFTAEAGNGPGSIDRQKLHPIHQNWSQAAIEKFGIFRAGKYHLPIIPDMSLLQENIRARDGRLPRPEDGQNPYPSIRPEAVFALRDEMEGRFKCVFDRGYDFLMRKKKLSDAPEAVKIRALLRNEYRLGRLRRIKAKFKQRIFRRLLRSNTNSAAAMFSRKLIESALLEFEERGLLDNTPNSRK